ncbi:type ISP restriction/modification enzyme, partial [Staphylococcus aureus]
INHEKQTPLAEINVNQTSNNYYVNKMKFNKKDKSIIIFNNDIKIENIPLEAYKYVINGKSAIEWIMDQYQVKTDKKSGIVDNPNKFSTDPQYILKLLLSVITVSVKTLELVEELPGFEIIHY